LIRLTDSCFNARIRRVRQVLSTTFSA